MFQSLTRLPHLFHCVLAVSSEVLYYCFNRSRVFHIFSTCAGCILRSVVLLFQSLTRLPHLFHSGVPRMAPEAASQGGLRGRCWIGKNLALFRCPLRKYT